MLTGPHSATLGMERERNRAGEGYEGAVGVGKGGEVAVRRDGPAGICSGCCAPQQHVESGEFCVRKDWKWRGADGGVLGVQLKFGVLPWCVRSAIAARGLGTDRLMLDCVPGSTWLTTNTTASTRQSMARRSELVW
jgi:hypothetical protein